MIQDGEKENYCVSQHSYFGACARGQQRRQQGRREVCAPVHGSSTICDGGKAGTTHMVMDR